MTTATIEEANAKLREAVTRRIEATAPGKDEYSDDFILRAAEQLERERAAPKQSLLDEVAQVTRERGETYGPPTEHFRRTVGMINALFAHKLREPFTIEDWPLMMMCDKMARHQEKPKRDNIVDVAGYADCWSKVCSQGDL